MFDLSLEKQVDRFMDKTPQGFVPKASVIIVTFLFPAAQLRQMLVSLLEQDREAGDFEVILVDNSTTLSLLPSLEGLPIRYIKTTTNLGAGQGRNLGAHYARAPILIFLDDDSIPLPGLVPEHIRIYRDPDILGARGHGIPRTKTIFNHFATHYDLGKSQTPSMINTEFNCSFRRDSFLKAGGFSALLAFHEGVDLSCRIFRMKRSLNALIYSPNPVVRHNYAESFSELVRKRVYNEIYYRHLYKTYPDCIEYIERFRFNKSHYDIPMPFWESLKVRCVDRCADILAQWRIKTSL